jgi:hypothetical protein
MEVYNDIPYLSQFLHKPIKLKLPEKAFEKAEKMDKELTDAIIENITKQYSPMDPILGLKIAL